MLFWPAGERLMVVTAPVIGPLPSVRRFSLLAMMTALVCCHVPLRRYLF
jgi:hypothetical protein